MIAVYQIRNVVTNKVYVGSSINAEGRGKQHFGLLRKGNHHSRRLQEAWNKYGEINFVFEILQICSDEDLRRLEQRYIDKLKAYTNGYNTHPEATITYMPSEIRERMSVSAKRVGKSPELQKQRAENAKRQHAEGRLGLVTWSPEVAKEAHRKSGEARRGKPSSKESVEKMRKTKKEVEWANPARRKRQAEIARELNQRPGHKEYLRAKSKEYWTPARRLEQAERAKAQGFGGAVRRDSK